MVIPPPHTHTLPPLPFSLSLSLSPFSSLPPPLCWWCSCLFSLHPVRPHLSWTCSSHTADGWHTRRRRRKRWRGEAAVSFLPAFHHFKKKERKRDQTRATTKRKDTQDIYTYIQKKKKPYSSPFSFSRRAFFFPFPPFPFLPRFFPLRSWFCQIIAPELLWDFRWGTRV